MTEEDGRRKLGSRGSPLSEYALDEYRSETMSVKRILLLLALHAMALFLAACGTAGSASTIGVGAIVPAEPAVQSGAVGPDLFALTEWDVVWISDNTGYYAAREYAKLIEDEFGVTVRLHDVVVRDL